MEPKTLELVRERWRRHRAQHHLLDAGDAEFGALGLASRVSGLSTHLLVLPADPDSVAVTFDEEFWQWWKGTKLPFDRAIDWGFAFTPSAEAAVRFSSPGSEWRRYLAVRRDGGVELGSADARLSRDLSVLPLLGTLASVWGALTVQALAAERYSVEGPWEVRLVLLNTLGSHLSNVAEGWSAAYDPMWDRPGCPDASVVIRREIDAWTDDLGGLVFEIGANMEDAWGIEARRYLNRRGDREGLFGLQ